MVEARLECLQRSTSGTDIMCNARDCDNCELNYAQGNIGEQKEWLKLAINAFHNQEQKTAHWIKVTNGRGGHECDICHEYAPSYKNGDEYLTKFCPDCGAKMVKPQESEVNNG